MVLLNRYFYVNKQSFLSYPCRLNFQNDGDKIIEDFDKKPESKSDAGYKFKKDILFVVFISIAVFIIAVDLDLYELLFDWSRQYDWLQIDEMMLTTIVFFPGLVWFSFRRWKDTISALNNALVTQSELEIIQLKQSETLQENRRLLRRISEIQEEERQRIAIDLHDIFGQHVTAIHANSSTIQSILGKGVPAYELAGKIVSSSQQLAYLARLMLKELHPPALENIGLDAALRGLLAEWAENHHDIDVVFSSEGNDDGIEMFISLAIYRCLQEGLTNIAKHATATKINFFIDYQSSGPDEGGHSIFMLLDDNGCGFIFPPRNHGLGLIGIRERITNLGGVFKVTSTLGKGTNLSISIKRHETDYG